MLLATPAASRRGKGKKSKGRKGREPAAPEEPDLDQWKAQVEAEGAPTVKLLPRTGGGREMVTRLAKADFDPRHGTIYTAAGERITAHEQIQDGASLIAVPMFPANTVNPGRLFAWPVYPIGTRFPVAGVDRPDDDFPPVELEVLHNDPKVFWVHNLFDDDEADTLMEEAQAAGLEQRGPVGNPAFQHVQESVVGAGPDARSGRWTTLPVEAEAEGGSETARRIAKRVFQLLRVKWDESMADGLHVSHYAEGEAAAPHLDYTLDTPDAPAHKYDPLAEGTNRWASIRLYLEDVDDGGETVFARGEPPSKSWAPPVPSGLYEEGSWEKSLAETCRTAFVVPPERGGALLYYGMGPDGEMDEKTLQGTCPVLEGEKWCAQSPACTDARTAVVESRRVTWAVLLLPGPHRCGCGTAADGAATVTSATLVESTSSHHTSAAPRHSTARHTTAMSYKSSSFHSPESLALTASGANWLSIPSTPSTFEPFCSLDSVIGLRRAPFGLVAARTASARGGFWPLWAGSSGDERIGASCSS